MTRFSTRFLAIAIMFTVAACVQSTTPPPANDAATASPTYTPDATIKDLMLGLIDTSADVVWLSVTTTVDSRGVVDVRPKNDEEWMEVRYGALRLAESANLLKIPGRRVAPPGDKSVAPGVELEPEEMQVNIDKDRPSWDKHADALREAAMQAFRAAEAKDADKIFELGETIEHACEGCHRQYWYPNEVVPPLPSAPTP